LTICASETRADEALALIAATTAPPESIDRPQSDLQLLIGGSIAELPDAEHGLPQRGLLDQSILGESFPACAIEICCPGSLMLLLSIAKTRTHPLPNRFSPRSRRQLTLISERAAGDPREAEQRLSPLCD
jgi:hypothetical protein